VPDHDPETVELAGLLEEFLERSRNGEAVSIEDYAGRYPDLADEIREVFEAAEALEDLGIGASPASCQHAIPERIGDFRIIREVGRGGMGVVYEAEQESLGRHVALKVLLNQRLHDETQLARFRREARLAAQLHHTNIVTVFGVGEEDGVHYFVMELAEGVSLDHVIGRLATTGELPATDDVVAEACRCFQGAGEERPWKIVARLGTQLCSGLQHAHGLGVVHRDIKPANIIVNGNGMPWISDFGLAKAMQDDDLSQTGTTAGTVRYMAPECFRGNAGVRSDLYAVGLVLHELLTHEPAFKESDRGHLIKRITRDGARPLRTLLPHVPRDLDKIIGKMTALDPESRYQSAAEAGEDLARFLAGQPVKARPLPLPVQLWRWARRNRTVASLAAAVAVLALATIVATVAGLVQTRRSLARETKERIRAEENAETTLQVLDSMFARFAPASPGSFSELSLGDESGTMVGLPNTPVLSTEAAALLKELLPLYDRLAAETGDELGVREKAAMASRRIADVQWQLGQYAEAATSYQRASELYGDLAAGRDDTKFVFEQAKIQNAVGQLRRATAEVARTLAAHQKALALLASLPSNERERPEVRFEVARTHYFLGTRPELQNAPGQGPGAAARPRARQVVQRGADQHIEQAIEILIKLLRDSPDSADCRYLLALCHRQRAHVGRQGIEAATRILEELVKDYPDVPDFRYELAQCYGTVPPQDNPAGAPGNGETEEQLRRGLELMEWLVRRHPYVSRYAVGRAQICQRIAVFQRRNGQLDEAEKHCRRSVEEMELLTELNPDTAIYTIWLGVYRNTQADILKRLGKQAEAEELLKQNLRDFGAVQSTDVLHALASRVAEQSRRMLDRRQPARRRPEIGTRRPRRN
jgi:serine/threonine protein kinase